MYICNVSMCVMYVPHMCVIYMGVSLICVSCMWYMCHICVWYMCAYTMCVCECVFMCVHMYLPQCVTESQRTTWKRLLSFFHHLDHGYIIWLRSSGLAEGFFPWSHQPLAWFFFSLCLFFSLSVSMSWTSLYFVILFKMAVCGIWNYHNLNFFFALNTKNANALSSGYFFFCCGPRYVILKEVF